MGGNAQYRKKKATKKSTKENYAPIYIAYDNMDYVLNTAQVMKPSHYPEQINPAKRATQAQTLSLMLGNNAKPTIVSSEELARLKQEEGAIILSRSTGSVSSLKDFTDNDYTVLPAGRWGGSAYGQGIYFDTLNGNTGYGDYTITGVLSKNAKIITTYQIEKMQQTGICETSDGRTIKLNTKQKDNEGALALALGYDAISISDEYNDYFVLLNRSALITDGRVY